MDPNELAKAAAGEAVKKAVGTAWSGGSWLLTRARGLLGPKGEATPPEPLIALPRNVLILGPGGTGKSTLARLLSGDVNVLIDPPGYYRPSLFVESVPLLGAPEVQVVVAPGQGDRLAPVFDAVAADIVRGAYRGLILVADYGHHAIEAEWAKDHRLYERTKPEFLAALHATQLQEELDLLDVLAPAVKAVGRRMWVLVVVLKQDLWAREQDRVARHYRDGAWGTKMAEAVAAGSDRLFAHTVFASLHIQNYTTKNGRETLRKNAAGYDAVRQRQSLEELFAAFDALRDWESRG